MFLNFFFRSYLIYGVIVDICILKRSIVHMDLDSFFVSCERMLDTSLNGKPVIIGGKTERGVVASCSYEARAFGVHSAMPVRKALTLCPDAILIAGQSATYSKYSKMVTDIIAEDVPLYEKSSIDEFYIDLSGMEQFFGSYKLSTELRHRIMRETGLPISFGLSENKTVSKIATGEAKPNNQIKIEHGQEKAFLAPLSIKKIPMVGTKTFQVLSSQGILKIEQLQQFSKDQMIQKFGKMGGVIWTKAQGIDNSPVKQYSTQKSISTERTFEKDTVDMVRINGILTAMAESLAYQLRKKNLLTSCVSIKIRYSDFSTFSQQKTIPYTTNDQGLIGDIKELFYRLYNPRLKIRLIEVRYSHLVSGGYQINLFEDEEQTSQLYEAMDKMREKFGAQAVVRAAGLNATYRGRFSSFSGEGEK